MGERYQVVIVGGGPVGVALAVDLGQRGVSCTLIERHMAPQRIPKGQNLTNRTLEHFYFWNCVEELRAARVMPPGYPIGGVTAYGSLMSEYWYAQTGGGGRDQLVQDFFFQRNERLPQYCTEEVLRARLAQLPSVRTLYGWSADRVEETSDGVEVSISPVAEGAQPFYSWSADTGQQTNRAPDAMGAQKIESDYMVGCDGGRSLVRETMGIDREGQNFDQRMVLAVFRSPQLHEGLRRFPKGTTYRVLKPELKGYWQFFGRIDVGEGFFFHAPVPSDTRPDNFDFHALLQEAAGFEFAAEFDHVGFWDLRIMVASQYRKGRMFIAGDAAHQHPPYGGFGLNTGLEDATNLGWKLAARLQGWGGDRLLASYDEERRPIFVETGEAMIAGGIERDRDFLERYNPRINKAEFETAWNDLHGARGSRQQTYEPHYEGSTIVAGPVGGVCSIHGQHTYAARPGHHLAPRALSSGRNTFEELGPGFTLLAFDAGETDVRALEAAAHSKRVPLKTVRDSRQGGREDYEAGLVLVRPDQYVVWAGDQAPPDVEGLYENAAGQ